MEQGRFRLIEAEIRSQVAEIDAVYTRIDDRSSVEGDAGLESLAYQLHNLYSAFEDLFRIVAAAFENNIEAEGGYHVALLKWMTIEVPEVRPALIDGETYELLDSLRGFRHFFRHAYAARLDYRKIEIVRQDAEAVRSRYTPLVDRFLAAIGGE